MALPPLILLLDFAEQVAAQEPDLVLIYAGQWLRPDGQAPSFGLHLVQREIYWGDVAHAETTANYSDNFYFVSVINCLRCLSAEYISL